MPNVVASKSRHSSFNFGWSSKIAHDLKIADKTTNASIVTKVEALGGYEALKKKIALVAAKHGAVIDPQVTSDIHRIFRLPGSINSKSSLAKIRCANVKEFNPFKEACVLGEQKISVKLKGPVKFNLKGNSFKLSKESAELPAYAAAYLVCKKLAEVEDSGSA
jgi:DNA primase small subunit